MKDQVPGGKKILIAEDDPEFIELVKSRLELEGFEVDSVKNGRELLEYVEKNPEPGCVILDLMMPEKSGIDILIAMKDRWRSAKVFVFTAYPEYRFKLPVLKFYVDDFVSKNEIGRLLDLVRCEAQKWIEHYD